MAGSPKRQSEVLEAVFSTAEDLIQTNDIDVLLDKILSEARRFTKADAGSIFLMHGDQLRFSYVHNDSLFGDDLSAKYKYLEFDIPIDERSIAGYSALTGRTLILDDTYFIPEDQPYTFNRDFDRESGYRTKSMLAAPLKTSRGKVVGVIQVINAMDDAGRVIPFSEEGARFVSFFANNAAIAVERAMMTREIILRMVKMSELRDPKETGAHVNRVGAYSAEIYDRWARNHGVSETEIKRVKDAMRVAAMLHDVGKVAISDRILKKPGKLDEQEFAAMRLHTVYGARLFGEATSDVDVLSREIALGHHERWDGRGYPGRVPDMEADAPTTGPGIVGDETPISARIVALADVYDALISKRVYKDAWPEDQVLDTVIKESGKHFDPGVVQAFFDIYDVIASIRNRYQEID